MIIKRDISLSVLFDGYICALWSRVLIVLDKQVENQVYGPTTWKFTYKITVIKVY